MSLLYKKNPTLKLVITQCDGKVELLFESDCGKFGTDEGIDYYKLSTKRLLEILQDRDNYKDEEL